MDIHSTLDMYHCAVRQYNRPWFDRVLRRNLLCRPQILRHTMMPENGWCLSCSKWHGVKGGLCGVDSLALGSNCRLSACTCNTCHGHLLPHQAELARQEGMLILTDTIPQHQDKNSQQNRSHSEIVIFIKQN